MSFFSEKLLVVFVVMTILGISHLNANTLVVSMGDNLVVIASPYDSETTIKGNFEAMKRDWNLDRVWWRGGQQNYLHEYWDLVHEETLVHYHIWDWIFKHNALADKTVDICKDLGLEVWLWTGLFEFGASKDSGGNSFLPNILESKLRKEHPEWLPVNKYGTRQQDGPIEFCYPEARAAYIQNLKDFLLKGRYDGIVFYTYAENFGTRYLDEFGFNQPIVDEFKKRYGVDILTEPFDKEAWSSLRGEYITQFLRELRTAVEPNNIKIAIQMSSNEPNLPVEWPGGWAGDVKTQRIGRILLDWHTWVDEFLIDELNVYYPGSVAITQEMLDYCQKHTPNVEVSVFLATGLVPAGAITVFQAGTAVQSGFPVKYVNSPPNNYPNPSQTLKTGDKWEKRQVLYLATLNIITLNLNDLAVASTNEDVFVRSLAVKALRESGLSGAVPFIEARLSDVENSVRCLAAVELGSIPGPNSLQAMLDTIVSYGNTQYNLFAVRQSIQQMKSDGTLAAAQKLLLGNYLGHSDPNVRQAVIYAIGACALANDFKSELLNMASNDEDNFCKNQAMIMFASYFGIGDTYDILKNNIEGTDQIIQVRAASALGYYGKAVGSYKEESLQLLVDLFQKYGSNNTRLDREWGWRCVGNALLTIGSEGEAELEKLICESTDIKIVDIAWRVLHIRQHPQKYMPVTEEQDRIANMLHPSKVKRKTSRKKLQ